MRLPLGPLVWCVTLELVERVYRRLEWIAWGQHQHPALALMSNEDEAIACVAFHNNSSPRRLAKEMRQIAGFLVRRQEGNDYLPQRHRSQRILRLAAGKWQRTESGRRVGLSRLTRRRRANVGMRERPARREISIAVNSVHGSVVYSNEVTPISRQRDSSWILRSTRPFKLLA